MKYCLDCEWFAAVEDGGTERERSRLALEHFVETGHAIDTSDSLCKPTPPPVCRDLLVCDLARSLEDSSDARAD